MPHSHMSHHAAAGTELPHLYHSSLQVGMATGATIHTANGLKCTVERRAAPAAAAGAAAEPAMAS